MQRDRKFDVFNLLVNDIFFDWQFNCRGQFTHESVLELAQSIRRDGLHFPIVVQPYPQGDNVKWRIVCGHRRFKAVTVHLNWVEIPAMIRDDLTEQQARMLNLFENLERKDLNVMEEAHAIQTIYPDGVSLRTAAAAFSKSERWVQTRLRLLQLPEEVQKKAAAGIISGRDIDELVKLESARDQVNAARTIEAQKRQKRTKTRRKSYRRRYKFKRSKAEVNKMIEYCWHRGIDGLSTRLLAWSNGYVDDDEMKKEIRDASACATGDEDTENVGHHEIESGDNSVDGVS